MSNLAELLDFSKIKDVESLYDHFYKVSAEIFYRHEIKTQKGEQYYITDLELYLHNPAFFEDPFMGARHHTQLTNGRFYVHRNSKNNHSFKKASYIGLDITCGNFNWCFAGLLIKGIQNVKTAEEISGSARVLNKLIGTKDKIDLRKKSWSNTELLKLHEIDDANIFKSDLITLKQSNKLTLHSEIYVGKRDNLKKVNSPKKEKYCNYLFKTVSIISKVSTLKLTRLRLSPVRREIIKCA
jgi:hypothetical protein